MSTTSSTMNERTSPTSNDETPLEDVPYANSITLFLVLWIMEGIIRFVSAMQQDNPNCGCGNVSVFFVCMLKLGFFDHGVDKNHEIGFELSVFDRQLRFFPSSNKNEQILSTTWDMRPTLRYADRIDEADLWTTSCTRNSNRTQTWMNSMVDGVTITSQRSFDLQSIRETTTPLSFFRYRLMQPWGCPSCCSRHWKSPWETFYTRQPCPLFSFASNRRCLPPACHLKHLKVWVKRDLGPASSFLSRCSNFRFASFDHFLNNWLYPCLPSLISMMNSCEYKFSNFVPYPYFASINYGGNRRQKAAKATNFFRVVVEVRPRQMSEKQLRDVHLVFLMDGDWNSSSIIVYCDAVVNLETISIEGKLSDNLTGWTVTLSFMLRSLILLSATFTKISSKSWKDLSGF